MPAKSQTPRVTAPPQPTPPVADAAAHAEAAYTAAMTAGAKAVWQAKAVAAKTALDAADAAYAAAVAKASAEHPNVQPETFAVLSKTSAALDEAKAALREAEAYARKPPEFVGDTPELRRAVQAERDRLAWIRIATAADLANQITADQAVKIFRIAGGKSAISKAKTTGKIQKLNRGPGEHGPELFYKPSVEQWSAGIRKSPAKTMDQPVAPADPPQLQSPATPAGRWRCTETGCKHPFASELPQPHCPKCGSAAVIRRRD